MKKRAKVPVVPVVVGLGAVAVAAVVMAQTDRKHVNIPTVQVNNARDASAAVIEPATDRKPLSFYTGGVRGDLFNAPLAPAPAPKKVETKKTLEKPAPPPAPAVVDPYADYSYTGTVTVGGKLMALVENVKTKEGQYLSVGDSFVGAKVTDIGERTLTLDMAGSPKVLAKTDDFKLTPLDKSAAYLTAQPQQTGPGQPGQPNAVPGQPGQPGEMQMPAGMDPNRWNRIQQRLQSMSPEQRQNMMNRWMNRSFDGGGRRGRRGGGGGFGGGGFGG